MPYTTDLTTLLGHCTENHGVYSEDSEGEQIEDAKWPNNILSRFARFDFENGIFQRSKKNPKKPVSIEEVDLCRRLAVEASNVFGDGDIGLGSASLDVGMAPFWLVATEGESVPKKIHGDLVMQRFNKNLFPPVTISVESIKSQDWKSSAFWMDITDYYGEDSEDEDDPGDNNSNLHNGDTGTENDDSDLDTDEGIIKWKRTIHWFASRSEFNDAAFVKIGDRGALVNLPESMHPYGTASTSIVLPRLVLGLTDKGSLVGLFSYIVDN